MSRSDSTFRMLRGTTTCVALAALVLPGCGAQKKTTFNSLLAEGVVAPASPAETEALSQLPQLDLGPHTLAGAVAVGPAYEAGSGRLCRSVGRRLACKSGENWIYVPDVFEVGP